MAKEKTADLPTIRWAIAPDWFDENHRSISDILKGCLCSKCAGKLCSGEKVSPPKTMMEAIHNCCSQSPGFINERTPLYESIFRFFLRNGNNPATVQELSEQLNLINAGNTYRNSPEILLRILRADRYYGLQEMPV